MIISQSRTDFQPFIAFSGMTSSGVHSVEPDFRSPPLVVTHQGIYREVLLYQPALDSSAVRVGNLWLPAEKVDHLCRSGKTPSPLDMAKDAVAQGLSRITQGSAEMFTQHALMLAWGEFAHEIGLIDQLRQIPIPQKSVVHTPQAKVLTFLMGTLCGINHLKDLNEGAHPLAHDLTAISAWGLCALPHYSGVSRTLAACDEQTVAAITALLDEISDPFINEEVHLLLKQKQPLILDLDLAPRRVSNQSTTFPDAEFGWQGDGVGLGYDAALVALTSPTYGRLFLSGFHYPRNPVGLPRLQQMVRTAEVRLGVRPKRRTFLVEKRLSNLQQQIAQRQQWLANQLDKQQELFRKDQMLGNTWAQLEAEIDQLETFYRDRGRVETSNSQLAKARRRQEAAGKKAMKILPALRQAKRAAETHQQRLLSLKAQETELAEYLAQLQADNDNNPDPVPMILRMDAGFGTDANITWLIEMGYHIYTKAHNAQVATKLRGMVGQETPLTRVGKNAQMVAWDNQFLHHCPYPLNIALERFHTPDGLKHSALIVYRDDGQELTLPSWFNFYNGRQLIEAGIKEGNVVFKMHPLKMRSKGGITLQEQFALFCANFVRWAAVWLRNKVFRTYRCFDDALTRVKTMVRVMANTSAWVHTESEAVVVRFDETAAYPGVEIRLAGTFRSHPLMLPQKKVSFSDCLNDLPSRCT
jgi:hypothetical protein